ncbi:DUF2971 domain-containing protein [Aeromonas jandaei]|uniref:DUF2971 domain-containing protein n=1 Tax=Aeromonas jandaei TaxID=650 RepID=UPI00398A459A
MSIFYKYTSNFGADFLQNPTIRISNTTYLNDPFECQAGDNLIYVAREAVIKNGVDYDSEQTRDVLNSLLNSHGIFSVSETPRSTLMWAHYADEHSGLCIGFDEDIFSNKVIPKGGRYEIAGLKPNKISYDNYRFDRQTEIKNSTQMLDSIKKHLLTKSDDWIYEKEHRWIVPYSFCSQFKIIRNNKHVMSSIDPSYHIDTYLGELLKRNEIEEIGKDLFKINKNIAETTYLGLATFGCVCFLYEVNPENIKSIHIGLRVHDDDVIDFYSTINNKDLNLSHIKLYKFKLSSKRFELLPDIVDENYINTLLQKRTSQP